MDSKALKKDLEGGFWKNCFGMVGSGLMSGFNTDWLDNFLSLQIGSFVYGVVLDEHIDKVYRENDARDFLATVIGLIIVEIIRISLKLDVNALKLGATLFGLLVYYVVYEFTKVIDFGGIYTKDSNILRDIFKFTITDTVYQKVFHYNKGVSWSFTSYGYFFGVLVYDIISDFTKNVL